MSDTASVGALAEKREPGKHAVLAYRSVAKNGTASAARVFSICARNAFVGRNELLVGTNGDEERAAHVLARPNV